MNFDSRGQQRTPDRAGRMVLHEVFIFALQQQAHPNTPFGRMNQRMAQARPRDEIRIGNDDFLSRLPNCLAVGAFDSAAVQQVVA